MLSLTSDSDNMSYELDISYDTDHPYGKINVLDAFDVDSNTFRNDPNTTANKQVILIAPQTSPRFYQECYLTPSNNGTEITIKPQKTDFEPYDIGYIECKTLNIVLNEKAISDGWKCEWVKANS